MADLQIRIKSKADLGAVKDAQKAVAGIGSEAKRSAKEVADLVRSNYLLQASSEKVTKQTERQNQEVKKAGEEIKKTESSFGKFAGSLKTQIFGSLVSFALVTKAVNAIRTVFAPALNGASESATRLGQALGDYIAQAQIVKDINGGLKLSFDSVAESIEAVVESRKKIDFGEIRRDVAPKLDFSTAPEGLKKLFGDFTKLDQAQAEFDRRKIGEIDERAASDVAVATERGATPAQIAEINRRARERKQQVLAESEAARLGRLRDLQSELPTIGELQPQIEAKTEADAARKKRIDLAADYAQVGRTLIGLEKRAGGNPRLRAATAQSLRAARERQASLRAQLEGAVEAQKGSTARFRELESGSRFPGVATGAQAEELVALGQSLFNTAAGGVASGISSNEGARQSIARQGIADRQLSAAQEGNRIQAELNRILEEQIRLQQEGFSLNSRVVQNLVEQNQRLTAKLNEVQSQSHRLRE